MATRTERAAKSAQKRDKMYRQFTEFMTYVVAPALTANLDHLVNKRYELKMSAMDIRNTYGTNCMEIFRRVFTLHQIGGRSAQGEAYVSMWIAHIDNMHKLNAIAKRLHKEHGQYTPAMVLEELIAAGAEPSMRIKLGEPNTVLTTSAEIIEFKKLVKELRAWEKVQGEEEHQERIARTWV